MEKEVALKQDYELSPENENSGVFITSLKRNNRQIREDRASAIVEDTELVYKRAMEDIALTIKRLQREQESMIDLSPANAQSLVLAIDFDSVAYTEKDLGIGIQIRNLEIKLEIATKRYNHLFGGA